MPVDISYFRKASTIVPVRNRVSEKLYSFLRDNRDKAFTGKELAEIVGTRQSSIHVSVNYMKRLGKIELRYVYTGAKPSKLIAFCSAWEDAQKAGNKSSKIILGSKPLPGVNK